MKYASGILMFFLCTTAAYCTDGNALLNTCQSVEKAELSDSDAISLQFCYGYIQGVIDDDDIWQGLMSSDKNQKHSHGKICLPNEGIFYTQLARIVVKYLKEHPEQLHWTGSVLVHNALLAAFRCPK